MIEIAGVIIQFLAVPDGPQWVLVYDRSRVYGANCLFSIYGASS